MFDIFQTVLATEEVEGERGREEERNLRYQWLEG